MSSGSTLWVERLYAKLGLPFLVGDFVVFYLPFSAALVAGYFVTGLWDDFIPLMFNTIPMMLILNILIHFGARHIRDKVIVLLKYAKSMDKGNSSIDLHPLYGLRGVLLSSAVANINFPLYFITYPPQYSFMQRLLVQLPWVYAKHLPR